MQTLLKSVHDFWNPAKNPSIRYTPIAKRVFHRDRNCAILLGLFRFSPVAVQAAKASTLAPIALINGEDLLDPKFFQSLSAKVNAPLKEKAKASASADFQRRTRKPAEPLIVSAAPRASLDGKPYRSETTVLHFSVTVDARAGNTRRKTKGQRANESD